MQSIFRAEGLRSLEKVQEVLERIVEKYVINHFQIIPTTRAIEFLNGTLHNETFYDLIVVAYLD